MMWCGGVVVWWCGGVVVVTCGCFVFSLWWWCGGVVVWWCGGGLVWVIVLLSGVVQCECECDVM